MQALSQLVGIAGFVLYLIVLSLFIMKVMNARRRKLSFLGAALVLAFLIAIFYGFGAQAVASMLFGIVLFNMVLSEELRGVRMPLAVLGFLFLLIFYPEGPVAMSVALMLGMSSELLSELGNERKISNREIELRRDFVHLFGGIVLFAAFLFINYQLDGYIIQYIFMIGIFVVFYAEMWRSSRFSMSLYKIEKHRGYVGYGAIWLGLGTLIAYSFLDKSFFLLVLLAIYFADPIATFAGSYKSLARLPHNRKKSIVGSLSYFAIVAVPGYLLVGPLSLLFAAVGAAVESLPIKLDDNFSVSAAMVILYFAIIYVGM